MQPADLFVGQYYNWVNTSYLDIFLQGGISGEPPRLFVPFNGHRQDKWPLSHYHYDTLSWETAYSEALHNELWPDLSKDFYFLEFHRDGDKGPMEGIVWRHNADVPAGETFVRRLPPSSGKEPQANQRVLSEL